MSSREKQRQLAFGANSCRRDTASDLFACDLARSLLGWPADEQQALKTRATTNNTVLYKPLRLFNFAFAFAFARLPAKFCFGCPQKGQLWRCRCCCCFRLSDCPLLSCCGQPDGSRRLRDSNLLACLATTAPPTSTCWPFSCQRGAARRRSCQLETGNWQLFSKPSAAWFGSLACLPLVARKSLGSACPLARSLACSAGLIRDRLHLH